MNDTTTPRNSCPIARALGVMGDLWSVLIIRDAIYGLKRFDEFQSSLKIAPNILTQRLKALVAEGILERRPYQTRPLRHEYMVTAKGRDLQPVLWALMAWGNRYMSADGHLVDLADPTTNAIIEPVMVDAATGRPLSEGVCVVPGPAATSVIIDRYGN
jgi:DNA-binding HxlR family transcriptional regulator